MEEEDERGGCGSGMVEKGGWRRLRPARVGKGC